MILRIIMLFQLMVVLSSSSSLIIKPDCQKKCGEIPISYPFGIGAGCYLDDWYSVNCTSSKPFLSRINLEVLNFSLEANAILVNHPVFNTCVSAGDSKGSANLESSPFFFSHTGNILFGRGCYFLAYINYNEIFAVCYSTCYIKGDPTYCVGINCCQSRIPLSLQLFNAYARDDNGIARKQCKLVSVVQEEWIVRNKWNPGNTKAVPVVLDWGIHNSSFHRLNMTTSTSRCNDFANSTSTNATFANKSFSTSTTASNSLVHQCNCKGGFQGNPYLLQGCQDIDECRNNSICGPKMSCRNVIGSYKCYPRLINTTLVILGVATGFPSLLLVLLGAWRLHIIIKRRKDIKLKDKYFKRNGGLLLQQLTSSDGNVNRSKLFNSKELDKATDHFNVDRILGRGGQGTVYKGMLTDGKIIAVKKPKAIDERKIEEFINEVAILSQINHRNVVKLLGCCLETEVPLLVYEFIPNGTLYQYLHAQNEDFPLTWERRLQIAIEVAGALSYLHSTASLPIYHRDVKSANILLDDKYRAKVADFGTSRSVAIDQTHVTTKVQGTFGYLDPEYFRSSQFTDKSDVYSFGVVLLELLTGQKPIISIGLEEGVSLVNHFMVSMQEDNLFDILDPQVKQLGKKEEIVTIANLANSCLNMNGKKRPTMKEVAMVLEGIQASSQKDNGNVPQDYEEVEHETHERTEITEFWDVVSTSTG